MCSTPIIPVPITPYRIGSVVASTASLKQTAPCPANTNLPGADRTGTSIVGMASLARSTSPIDYGDWFNR
jgi:hypothetical protein